MLTTLPTYHKSKNTEIKNPKICSEPQRTPSKDFFIKHRPNSWLSTIVHL